jgi:iron complex outermembrane receptor protein
LKTGSGFNSVGFGTFQSSKTGKGDRGDFEMVSTSWLRAAMMASISLGAVALAAPAFAQEATSDPVAAAEPVPAAETQAAADVQASGDAQADAAATNGDQDIVVTARRRSEVLQDVPIAVTAYSGEQLERQGAVDITEVAYTTPNVKLEVSRCTNTTLSAFISGVGQQDPVAGFEQGVGIYLDDVYLNRPQGAVLDIYDVERVEILRGPQGTLYGRNTVGGAVKYVTRRLSTSPEMEIRANLGTYEQADLVVTASTPLTDTLRIGGAFARLSRGGFGKNLTTGDENYNKDVVAGRASMEFEPSDSIFFRLAGDYAEDDSNARGGHRLIPGLLSGAPVLDDKYDSRGALDDPKQNVKGGGASLFGEIGLSDWLKFRTITAYRKDRTDSPIDFDALPAVDVDVPAIYKNRQFSQELQLVVDKGPLAGVLGAYYLDANANNVFDVRLYTTLPAVLPGLTAGTNGDVDTKTWAIFGDFSYDITPQISVSVGARYTNDKRHARVFRANYLFGGSPELGGSNGFGDGAILGAPTSDFDGKRTDTAFTPRASISFKPNKDNNFYASYSRGFKGGGFDPRGLTSATPDFNGDGVKSADEIYEFMAFDPETVDSYELGWKGAAFDRRLHFALALFQANYKDIQIPGSAGGVINGVPTFVGVTTNAGKARFRGAELETNLALAEDLAAAGDRLNVTGSVGYLDAKFLEYITNIPGEGPVDVADFRKIQNTPKWTLSGGVDYDTPAMGGRLNANAQVSYRSKTQQFELAIPELDQKGYALLDANLVWRSPGNRYTIGLHGKNLTDTRYITSGYNFLAQDPRSGDFLRNGSGQLIPALGKEGVLTAYYGNPRQVFVSLGLNF